MKIFKAKPFDKENNDKKIHSCASSSMKRKLSIDINTKGSLMVKPKFIIFMNPTNEGDDQSHDKNLNVEASYRKSLNYMVLLAHMSLKGE